MSVGWSRQADMRVATWCKGSRASASSGYTAQCLIRGIPPESLIHYEVRFDGQSWARGQFRSPPNRTGVPVRLAWSGDVCGQGWGIDESRGGMQSFASLTRLKPDFFLHCGDSIYADAPLSGQVMLADGSLWRNRRIPEKTRKAQNLDDFRGNYRYNFLDAHYRRFFSQVSVVAQWDDHEVEDNWDPLHQQKLAVPARQAFLEYWPLSGSGSDRKMYRKISYGPDLDLLVLDLRSYRDPNSHNRQPAGENSTALLGRAQLDWLKACLLKSKATWKVLAGEMPIACYNLKWGLDSWANGQGPPLGREGELAELLSFVRKHEIKNLLWLCADVHYSAALHYRPERAEFRDFLPFWEFISGPMHAGTFPPSLPLDPTFGPEMVFCAVPGDTPPNLPPSQGLQFFGMVEIQGAVCRVSLHRQDGKILFSQELS